MKKAIAILVLVVVICALSQGCLENTEHLSLGKTATLDDISFTVVTFEERDSYYEYYDNYYGDVTPPEGATFLFVYVKAKNVGEVARYVPSPSWDINMLYKGEEIEPERISRAKSVITEPIYNTEEIYPTVTKEGWIAFEVPKGIAPSQAKIRVESPIGRYSSFSQKVAIWTLA